jgi:bisphosphoglycerate-dependent phosphoglycerate mutase
MVVKGIIPEQMDIFRRTFEEMYPPFTQKEMDIADKMEKAFKEYEKKNHNFFNCVRRIISKAILFFEERARSRMLDEQRNE